MEQEINLDITFRTFFHASNDITFHSGKTSVKRKDGTYSPRHPESLEEERYFNKKLKIDVSTVPRVVIPEKDEKTINIDSPIELFV